MCDSENDLRAFMACNKEAEANTGGKSTGSRWGQLQRKQKPFKTINLSNILYIIYIPCLLAVYLLHGQMGATVQAFHAKL